MDGPLLFLCFRRHTHQRQRLSVALDKAVQLQTERFGIQPIGLHSFVALIELLWTDHVTADPQERLVAAAIQTQTRTLHKRRGFLLLPGS